MINLMEQDHKKCPKLIVLKKHLNLDPDLDILHQLLSLDLDLQHQLLNPDQAQDLLLCLPHLIIQQVLKHVLIKIQPITGDYAGAQCDFKLVYDAPYDKDKKPNELSCSEIDVGGNNPDGYGVKCEDAVGKDGIVCQQTDDGKCVSIKNPTGNNDCRKCKL